MFQISLIVLLLLIISIMTWVWYIQPKIKNTTSAGALNNLKVEFETEYHDLIDSISKEKNVYDASKILLNHIKTLTQKQIEFEKEVKTHESDQHKVEKVLKQKNNEIIHISHQMRTSLSGLLGFAHFLKETKLDEEQEEFVSIIETSSNELLVLVNSIIDMTPKSSTGTENYRIEPKEPVAKPKNEIPNVLVVDDNDINKRLLAKVLENENLTVTYASNGEEAVLLRKDNNYDVIFMDIQMPVMDGVQASKAIRIYESEQNIEAVPIIALTANTGKNDRDIYLEAGMTDYMAKPIIIDDVREKIAKLF